MTAVSINIKQTMSGRNAGTVNDPGGVASTLASSLTISGSGPMIPGEMAFFSFNDLAGSNSTYFGFAYFYDSSVPPTTLALTATTFITSNAFGVMTNIAGASATSANLNLSSSAGDGFYYYMYAGVSAAQTISISGTVSNSPVRWLSWTGSAWSDAGLGQSGTGSFALGSAFQSAPIPGAGLAAGLGGLGGGLLARRRSRKG